MDKSGPLAPSPYTQKHVRYATPLRMPCKKAAPTGRTPRKTKDEREISKPHAAKHFTQREKKYAMAQVYKLILD